MLIISYYFFSILMLLCALFVVFSRSIIVSILCLIGCFFAAAVVWMTLGGEFLSMALLFINVGALMSLFLFAVMLLDLRAHDLKFKKIYFLLFVIGIVGFVALLLPAIQPSSLKAMSLANSYFIANNSSVLGRLLYTHYALLFEITGVLLLVSLVGTLILLLRKKQHA